MSVSGLRRGCGGPRPPRHRTRHRRTCVTRYSQTLQDTHCCITRRTKFETIGAASEPCARLRPLQKCNPTQSTHHDTQERNLSPSGSHGRGARLRNQANCKGQEGEAARAERKGGHTRARACTTSPKRQATRVRTGWRVPESRGHPRSAAHPPRSYLTSGAMRHSADGAV